MVAGSGNPKKRLCGPSVVSFNTCALKFAERVGDADRLRKMSKFFVQLIFYNYGKIIFRSFPEIGASFGPNPIRDPDPPSKSDQNPPKKY